MTTILKYHFPKILTSNVIGIQFQVLSHPLSVSRVKSMHLGTDWHTNLAIIYPFNTVFGCNGSSASHRKNRRERG